MRCHEQVNSGEVAGRSYQSRTQKKKKNARSEILTDMCALKMFVGKLKRSLKPDSRAEIPMRWTLAVSQKGCFVAVVVSDIIGQQIVPNVARMVKEANMRVARDGARKASQAKGKLMMTKEEAKVACGKHARHFEMWCNHCWKWGLIEEDGFPLNVCFSILQVLGNATHTQKKHVFSFVF